MTTLERDGPLCISRGLLVVPRSLAIGCDNLGVPLARSTLLLKDFGIAACTKNIYIQRARWVERTGPHSLSFYAFPFYLATSRDGALFVLKMSGIYEDMYIL
ncbi:hypothetical protein TNCV_852011 [Trichonephila clavipes]|nr:hypothetical protein TNCV_852011 [Trichonephila clavipes]